MQEHPLITQLLDAICEKQESSAIQLIIRIQISRDPAKPNLFTFRDNSGQSIMAYAFLVGCYEVANSLLGFAFREKNLAFFADFFALDKIGCHIFHYAVNAPFGVLNRLFNFYDHLAQNQLGKTPDWLKKGDFGRTLLHKILLKPPSQIRIENIKFILERVAQVTSLADFINCVDGYGDSAFSYLFMHAGANAATNEIIALLLSYQANPYLKNNYNINNLFHRNSSQHLEMIGHYGLLMGQNFTAEAELLDAIRSRPLLLLDTTVNHIPIQDVPEFQDIRDIKLFTNPSKVTYLFSLASNEEKDIILKICERLLRDNPRLNNVAKFYFHCLGAVRSLKELAAAHCNFNLEVPRGKGKPVLFGLQERIPFYLNRNPEKFLPTSELIAKDRKILAEIYLYTQNLRFQMIDPNTEAKVKELSKERHPSFLMWGISSCFSFSLPFFKANVSVLSGIDFLYITVLDVCLAYFIQMITENITDSPLERERNLFKENLDILLHDIQDKIMQPLHRLTTPNKSVIQSCANLITLTKEVERPHSVKHLAKLVDRICDELRRLQGILNRTDKPFLLFAESNKRKHMDNAFLPVKKIRN